MLKRLFDITAAIVGLILFSPILLLIAILIKLDSKGPVFFKQERIGIGCLPFKIYKFRTMYINSESKGLLTTGMKDPRITRVGYFIRKLHLDEIIQLINVLFGEMSIVGPRPEIPKYTKYYPKDWNYVLQVKPGITGLAQVKYAHREYQLLSHSKQPEKTYISILPKKLRLEKFYIKHQSIGLDLKIILLTVGTVIHR